MSTRENKMTAPLRDTHANWTTLNPVVPEGVLGITKDRLYTGSVEYFIGNGTSTYTQLAKFGDAHGSDGKIPIADILTNVANGLLKLDTDGKALADNLRITGAIADGAIIESGSNANGYYTKYTDGTLFCTIHKTVNNFALNIQWGDICYNYYSLVFPATFIDIPIITACGTCGDTVFIGIRSATNATAQLTISAPIPLTTYTLDLYCMCISRWKA